MNDARQTREGIRIHEPQDFEGMRAAGPFVPVNCGAIPAELIFTFRHEFCRTLTDALIRSPGSP